MKIALVNPKWSYDGSIYFGCRAPHLPLELGYCKALLEHDGHDVKMWDGDLQNLANEKIAEFVAAFAPAMTIVTTAPTYLFWRCTPPELSAPQSFLSALAKRGGQEIAVGPHGSSTPGAVMRKLGVDKIVMGECEEIVAAIARDPHRRDVCSTASMIEGKIHIVGSPHASSFTDHPPLRWPNEWIQRHTHHHHRFDHAQSGFGAEVEASRGCQYDCTFCAKVDFRNKYRRRKLEHVLDEIDALAEQGVEYIYFIDEIFQPQKALLNALVERPVQFGVQTRIDLWKPDMLALLGKAGCVSIEAGLESLTREGRDLLDKNCRMSTQEIADLLIEARRNVPFVQANLIASPSATKDEETLVAQWRKHLLDNGVWANEPVPLYPYPASPAYRKLWGAPDDHAWERAHAHYLAQFNAFSDIQDARPKSLYELEAQCCIRR